MIHPNTQIGDDVEIGHGVTIAGNQDGPPMIVGNRVKIGASATIIPESGRAISIGNGAIVGAASLLRTDVLPDDRVAGNPAQPTKRNRGF